MCAEKTKREYGYHLTNPMSSTVSLGCCSLLLHFRLDLTSTSSVILDDDDTNTGSVTKLKFSTLFCAASGRFRKTGRGQNGAEVMGVT